MKKITRHIRFHSTKYVNHIKPPYTKRDILPITLSVIFLLIGVTFLLGVSDAKIKLFASTPDTVPPSQVKVLLGNELPAVVPHTHSEQKSVHLFWRAAMDNEEVKGYKIYRNGTKIGETPNTMFDDFGVVGKLLYTIEAYDAAGNISKTNANIVLPERWNEKVSEADSVMAGFVVNRNDGKPVKGVKLTITAPSTTNVSVGDYTRSDGYYYHVFRGANDGKYKITVTANGYENVTQEVSLKKGYSVYQSLFLTPK